MSELEDCPFCQNQGWYPDYDRYGEIVQVQCEFCWTNPLSKFNATNKSAHPTPESGGILPAVESNSENTLPTVGG